MDWIAHQLAHSVRDPNGRAYNRTTHLKNRRVMMQAWSDYLDHLRISQTEKVRGGVREGAGRKKKFTDQKLIALANEVTLLQQKDNGLSVSGALDLLLAEGLILPQERKKYLTPAYVEDTLMPFLKEAPRVGILRELPRLSKDDPL